MFSFRSKPKSTTKMTWEEAHLKALTDRTTFNWLMVTKGPHLRVWDICGRHAWREFALTFNYLLRQRPVPHYSLRAHYERLDEIVLEELWRSIQKDTVVSDEVLENAQRSLMENFAKLNQLNTQAWEQEAKQVDSAGAMDTLIKDAQRTVADREFTS